MISTTSFGSTQWTRERTSGDPKRVERGGETIGFRSGYETGEQLLAWYCDLLEEHRRVIEDNLSEIDHSVPVTETGLSEEVANHPAVKAAAQAYAEAVARASVEARKKNL